MVWSSGGGEDCTGTLLQCGGEVTRAVIEGRGEAPSLTGFRDQPGQAGQPVASSL